MSDPTIEDGATASAAQSADALAAYVGANPTKGREYVDACAAEAEALVKVYVGDAAVPDEIRARAVLEVGAELFHRQQAPSGIRQFADPGEQAGGMRVARDPMTRAYAILNPYMAGGFA